MKSHLEKVVQNFELKRVGGAPKDHLFAPLKLIIEIQFYMKNS